ncbi:hypothetical protein CR513_43434, partial [Mucuna pruriens]
MAFSLFVPWVSTLVVVVVLHGSLCEASHRFSRYGGRISEDGWTRHLFESRASQKCGELVAQSQCSQNSKCSWCTSQDLDDMCFTKSEASRLPHQDQTTSRTEAGEAKHLQTTLPNAMLPFNSQNNSKPAITTTNNAKKQPQNQMERKNMSDLSIIHGKTQSK